jgi:dCMP deaminase
MNRPSWDTYFQDIARAVAQRSSCPRAQVGAVVVNEQRRIVATGYNGARAGHDNCLEVGCFLVDNHCKRAIHAEVNAIEDVLFHRSIGHEPRQPLRLYMWDSQGRAEPCQECLGLMEIYGFEYVPVVVATAPSSILSTVRLHEHVDIGAICAECGRPIAWCETADLYFHIDGSACGLHRVEHQL